MPELYESAALDLSVGDRIESLDCMLAKLEQGLQYTRLTAQTAKLSRGEFTIDEWGAADREVAEGGAGLCGSAGAERAVADAEQPSAGAEQGVVGAVEDAVVTEGCGYLLSVHPVGSDGLVSVRLGVVEGDGDSMSSRPLVVREVRQHATSREGPHAAAKFGAAEVEIGTTSPPPVAVVDNEPRVLPPTPVSLAPSPPEVANRLLLFPTSHHVLPDAERARVLAP